MAGTLATLVRSMGKVASTAVAVTAQQNAAARPGQRQGGDLSKCTPCAAKAAVAAARAQVTRGQR